MDLMPKIYAVDFDGTLALTNYPDIIEAKTDVIEKIKYLKERGNTIILWTCRCGKSLEQAIDFCKDYGLEFDYVNQNTQENIDRFGNDCRKIFAHYYIDDNCINVLQF